MISSIEWIVQQHFFLIIYQLFRIKFEPPLSQFVAKGLKLIVLVLPN